MTILTPLSRFQNEGGKRERSLPERSSVRTGARKVGGRRKRSKVSGEESDVRSMDWRKVKRERWAWRVKRRVSREEGQTRSLPVMLRRRKWAVSKRVRRWRDLRDVAREDRSVCVDFGSVWEEPQRDAAHSHEEAARTKEG